MSRAIAPHSRLLARSTTRRSLIVELDPEASSGLLRTISLLHRRQCHVVRAEYVADPGAPARLELSVDAPSVHAHCLEGWLRSLVDVRTVALAESRETSMNIRCTLVSERGR